VGPFQSDSLSRHTTVRREVTWQRVAGPTCREDRALVRGRVHLALVDPQHACGGQHLFDRLMIATELPSAGWIYDGRVGTGEFSKPVAGASHSYVGDWLCTSSGYSGAVCNIRVTATNASSWTNEGPKVELVRAEQIDHIAPVGQGDSGGPVFSLTADYSKVIAKGIITSADSSAVTTCTGVQVASAPGGSTTSTW
jgi:hypothetical protein